MPLTRLTLVTSAMIVFVTGACLTSCAEKKPPSTAWFALDHANSSLLRRTPSSSIAWGDPNGDGFADLWSGNHGTPYLFINDHGKLNDASDKWGISRGGDSHGVAWADFNNDGFVDLAEQRGGARGRGTGAGNKLYLNGGKEFEDVSAKSGIEFPKMRGRAPFWFDFDQDNQLDLLLTAISPNPIGSTILRQNKQTFLASNNLFGFNPDRGSSYAQLAHIGEDKLILIQHQHRYPGDSYLLRDGGVQATTLSSITRRMYVRDSLWADLNGDGIDDLVTVQDKKSLEFRLDSKKKLHAYMVKPATSKASYIEFRGPSELDIKVYPHSTTWWNRQVVYVGGKRLAASAILHGEKTDGLHFSASASAGANAEPALHGDKRALQISFNKANKLWRVTLSGSRHENASLVITGESKLENIVQSAETDTFQPKVRLFLSTVDGFTRSKLPLASASCNSVTGGDFDNDADIDLIIVCGTLLNNTSDHVLENNGKGNFRVKKGEPFGPTYGVADSVAAADYNRDGTLDLVISNGASAPPFNRGPLQFFHGLDQENNYFQVDLTPPIGHAFPYGARLSITSGGITQTRTIGGGIHNGAQNDQVEHFGMGEASKVERLVLKFPDGRTKTINNLTANQRYNIPKTFYQK